MAKHYLLPLLFLLTLFSCNSSEFKNKTADSLVNPKRGITVNTPLEKTRNTKKDSIYTGTRIDKYDNGVIYIRGDVMGGLRVGEWLSFYRSGKLWSKGNYENGLRVGYAVTYFENEKKSSKGYYKGDRMVGKWKFWDEFGNMVEKEWEK